MTPAPPLEEHLPLLHRLAHGRVPGHLRARMDTDDLVGSICRVALEWQATFHGTPGKFVAWLCQTARRHITTCIRREICQKRTPARERPDQDADALTGPLADPAQLLERAEQLDLVRSGIAQLPPAQREALALFHLEGLSQHEVTARTGMSKSAVGVNALRARARLARDLSDTPLRP